LGRLSTVAVCWRTKDERLRQPSRTARSAVGEMYPACHTPQRNKWANHRASAEAAVYFRPWYGCLAAGLARGTR
jgi:hypothetical protein